MFAFFMVVFGLKWLDGGTWYQALSDFQGIAMWFAFILGAGMFFTGKQIGGLVLIFVGLLFCAFTDRPQQWGAVTSFNATHQDEMSVYDATNEHWDIVKLPLRHPGDRLIKVSDWQWNLADPDAFNEDWDRPERHPQKLVETRPGSGNS